MPTRGPGRNKKFLLSRLQDMYGKDFHPIMKMAENANTLQKRADALGDAVENQDLLDCNKAWEKIAEYTEPKLKAVEVSGELETRTVVRRVNLTGDSSLDGDNADS